jgi:hypothetical protein
MAVTVGMAGMNPMRYLNSEDEFERRVMESVARLRVETASEERQDLADRIINRLGESMKKK